MANVIVLCFSPANGKLAVGDPGMTRDGLRIRSRKICFIYFSMWLLLKKMINFFKKKY